MKRAIYLNDKSKKKLTRLQRRELTRQDIVRFCNGLNWNKMWEEFLMSRDSRGALTYPSVWSFAKEKGNSDAYRRIIYWRIGPPPAKISTEKSEEARMPVNWLGDWQSARMAYFNYSNKKVDALKTAIEERQTALEAVRGTSIFHVDWISKAERWSQQVDAYFRDLILVPGKSMAENSRRARLFFTLQRECFKLQQEALSAYMRSYGVNEDDISFMAQIAAAGSKAALAGVAVGATATALGTAVENSGDQTLKLMMESFKCKASMYNLKAPEIDIEEAARDKEKVLDVVEVEEQAHG